VSARTSRSRRVLIGVIATLTLAGVGATSATAATTLSAHGHLVGATQKDWNGN
jgi:hypothetical protein